MDPFLRYPWVRYLLILSLSWALSACISLGTLFAPSSETPPPPGKTKSTSASLGSPRAGYLHTVRWQGETLCLIAQWYTGSWKNWKSLADANSAINPDRLVVGDRVVIPEGLLKNRKPLPREFVASPTGKDRGPQMPSHPEEAGSLDLFGPKE